MVVKSPKNEYEKQILSILLDSRDYVKLSSGEKSILYDLATQEVPKYVHFNWEDIILENYLFNIKLSYNKHKNEPGFNVVCACINKCFPNYIATMEGPMYEKTIVVKEVK